MRWTPVMLVPPFLLGVAPSLSAQVMSPVAVTRAAMPGPVQPRLVLFHEDDAVGRAPLTRGNSGQLADDERLIARRTHAPPIVRRLHRRAVLGMEKAVGEDRARRVLRGARLHPG